MVSGSGIGTQTEWSERGTEVSSASKFVWLIGNTNVLRQIVAWWKFVTDYTSHTGIRQGWAWAVSGEHVVRSPLVGCLAVRHRVDDRHLVGDLSEVFEVLAESQPGNFRLD